METEERKYRKILLILIIMTLCFIWFHSAVPAAESYEESGFVLNIAQYVFGENITGYMVRKAAYFLEYTVLGGLLSVYALWDQIRWKIVFVLSVGGLAAVLDETIQIFSGRNSQASDVLLDLSGVAFAFVVVMIVNRVFSDEKNHRL